jgi:Raf kinase inhibitor-like YbhB/YbcL family protein
VSCFTGNQSLKGFYNLKTDDKPNFSTKNNNRGMTMRFNLQLSIPLLFFIFLVGCGGGSGDSSDGYATPSEVKSEDVETTPVEDASDTEGTLENDNSSAFVLTSDSYTDGNAIPLLNACTALGGTDVSPQFSWANPPAETAGYALIMHDETSPCGTESLSCVHWALFNIPASTTSLDSDLDISTIDGAVEGYSYIPTTDYEGPCPPSVHSYNTTVYALDDSMAEVPANSTFTRSTFASEYSNNILGQAEIVGTFTPDSSPSQETFSVTVATNNNGPGRVYVINGQQKSSLTLNAGTKYIFNHPAGHPLRFSTTADGTNNNGSEYTAGVDRSTSGTTEIEVTSSTPATLYYYCSLHAGMGGIATISGAGSSGTRY